VSVRAYDAQNSFKEEVSKRIDKYTRISRTTYNLTRWMAIRIDFLGDLYNATLAYYLVYWSTISSSNAGFSLNMATDLCSYIVWSVLFFNDFIVQLNRRVVANYVAYSQMKLTRFQFGTDTRIH
jgi:hypothetical protein